MNDTMTGVSAAPSSQQHTEPHNPARRGFAAMAPEVVREIARRGGVAAHVHGTAHEFTSAEARVAGRKGGLSAHRRTRKRTEVSF